MLYSGFVPSLALTYELPVGWQTRRMGRAVGVYPEERVEQLGAAFLADAGVTGGAAVTVAASQAARELVWASDLVVAGVAELQYSLGDGPAETALATYRPVLINDVAAPGALDQWPAFAEAAAYMSVGALFAFPMQLGATTIGVCDIYQPQPGQLGESELSRLLHALDRLTADLASVLAGIPRQEDGADLFGTPDQGHSRMIVHQATGMLTVQLGIGADVAFTRLRAHAFTREQHIEHAATDIVEHGLRLDPDPQP